MTPALAFDTASPPRFAGWRQLATPGRLFLAGAALYLLLCALAFFVVRPVTLLYFTDYWEHRAIIREMMRGGVLHDPVYGEAASSRQFPPWSLLLAWLARWSDVDSAMAMGAMLVSLLFVAGVYDFARSYFRHRWAPPVLLAVLTCGWGLPPLIWTGFYALRSHLHSNYYPAALVFSLTFIAWAAVARLLRGERFGVVSGLLLCAIVAVSFITHPLNAALLAAGAMAMVVFEAKVPLARRAMVTGVIGIGVISTSLWPWFDPLSLAGAGLARGQATFNNFAFFFDPLFFIAMAWPAIFALMALPGLLKDRSARMPLVALAVITLGYVGGGIADISVSHRLMAYVILALHLLLVKAVLAWIDGQPLRMMDALTPRARRWVTGGAGLLIAWQVGLGVGQLVSPWSETHYPYPLHAVAEETDRVVATLPPNARILGWDSAALVMPTHGVLVAAFPRPMPLSPSDAQRQADYRRFFTAGVSTCERRAIAHRWGATHIAWLANELKIDPAELAPLGPVASPVGPWRIIALTGPNATSC